MKKLILLSVITVLFLQANAQFENYKMDWKKLADETTYNVEPDWLKDAKFGIFVHWGIYAVDGIDESWSFFNEYISYEDYMKQLGGFTASKYDPAAWVTVTVTGERPVTVVVIVATRAEDVALAV